MHVSKLVELFIEKILRSGAPMHSNYRVWPHENVLTLLVCELSTKKEHERLFNAALEDFQQVPEPSYVLGQKEPLDQLQGKKGLQRAFFKPLAFKAAYPAYRMECQEVGRRLWNWLEETYFPHMTPETEISRGVISVGSVLVGIQSITR